MSDLKINNITDRTGDSGPVITGVSTVSSTGAFTVPSGPTEYRGGRGRGVFAGAATPSYVNVIDYVEIATTGNATDFGDLETNWYNIGGCASSTRGILFPGYDGSTLVNTIFFITVSSSGGTSDFGDTMNVSNSHSGACNDSTRAVRAQGYTPAQTNLIEYITIASTGDAKDFGDSDPTGSGKGHGDFPSSMSDSHGGIS